MRSIICFLMIMLLAVPAMAGPVLDDILNYAIIDQQALDDDGTVEITPDKPVGQTFVTGPNVSELFRVTVQIGQEVEKWSPGEQVTLTVWDSPQRKSKLASYMLDDITVRNRLKCDPVYIRCKAAPNTAYYFEITHNGKGDGKADVRTSGKDSYAAGSAYIAGEKQQNDLWFRVVVKNKADHQQLMENMFSIFNLNAPGMEKVKAAVEKKDWDTAVKETVAHWDSRPLSMFHDPKYERKKNPDADLSSAKALLENRYKTKEWDFQLGERPNWWADPKPGESTPASGLSNYGLPRLVAYAYLVTGDEKYAKKGNELYDQWMLDNPPPTRENIEWFDEAYSGLQIIRKMGGNAWYYYGEFLPSSNLTTDTRMAFIHLQSELAKCAYTGVGTKDAEGWGGNWGFQVYNSLFDEGVESPEYADSPKWVDFSVKKLVELSRENVAADGILGEAAPNYHNMCARRLKHLLEECSKRNIQVPSDLTDILAKMYTFTMYLTQPDGTTPMFGDSDSEKPADELKSVGTLLNRPDMLCVASQGKEGTPPKNESIGFIDSGYYFMKASNPTELYADARYLAVHNGNWYGTHGHHDRLGPVVYAYGRPLLIDPGRFEYSKEHDWFWPSFAHNVITIDGQNYLRKYYAHEGAVYTRWNSLGSMDFFDGRCQPDDGVFIDRQILFVKPYYWIVTDQVRMDKKEPHKIEQRWHFAPTTISVDPDTKVVTTGFTEGGNLQMIPLAAKKVNVKQEQGWVAFDAGKKLEAPQVIMEREEQTPVHYATILRPFKGTSPTGVFESRFISPVTDVSGDMTALAVRTSYGTDYIAVSHNADGNISKLVSKELSCKARALRATLSPKGMPLSFSWVDGVSATIGHKKLAYSSAAIKELNVKNDGKKVVITSSQKDPSLVVYVAGAKQAVVNGRAISLKRGQKYLKPFAKG